MGFGNLLYSYSGFYYNRNCKQCKSYRWAGWTLFGVTLIITATLSIILTFAAQHTDNESLGWLSDNYQDLIVFAAALTGALLGFLRYNAYPAEI